MVIWQGFERRRVRGVFEGIFLPCAQENVRLAGNPVEIRREYFETTRSYLVCISDEITRC
jgi:hypothetical protein